MVLGVVGCYWMLLNDIGSSIGCCALEQHLMVLNAERDNSPCEHRAALVEAHQKRGQREQEPVQEHENPVVIQTPHVLAHIIQNIKQNIKQTYAGAATEEQEQRTGESMGKSLS